MRWDCGIDLGTANARMALAGGGILLDEPARLALSDGDATLYAGENAWRLLGREPRGLRVESPLRDGMPESEMLLTRSFQWLYRRGELLRRRKNAVLVSCSPAARPAYREALMVSALDAGATDVALVRSDAACALGSGVDLMGPQATFLVDVGAGKMTATLFPWAGRWPSAACPTAWTGSTGASWTRCGRITGFLWAGARRRS